MRRSQSRFIPTGVPACLLCLSLSALWLAPAPARADWPTARHDAQRTGASPAKSNITEPVAYWRTYLGGDVPQNGMVATDVNQDGKVEVVLVSGGRLVAKRPNDDIVWQSEPRGLSMLVGVDDLDGDGKLDAVAAGDRVYVFAGASGALEWIEPDAEMGCLGGVRLGDLNGDGLSDLLIQEHGCCGASLPTTGFVYSFGPLFEATLLWKLPWVPCGAGGTTLVDVDGNGTLEVLLWSWTDGAILNGKTGAVLAKSPVLGNSMSFATCLPVDVDGAAGEELACIQNYKGGGGDGARRVLVLAYKGSPGPSFGVLWQHDVGDFDGGDVAAEPQMVSDLDGDGAAELVVSGMSAGKSWTTYVYDAATGKQLASIPGERTAGTAAIEKTGTLLLTTSGTTLAAWSYSALAKPPLEQRWTLADRRTVTEPDWKLVARSGRWQKLVTIDLDGDGIADLVTEKVSAGAELDCYAAAGGKAVSICSFPYPADVDPLHTWIVPPIDEPYPQIAVARNDGFLTLLDDKCQPTNGLSKGRPGVRIGGYYSGAMMSDQRAPVVAALGDPSGPQAIVVPDSRGALVRFDAKEASWVAPPEPAWSRPRTTAPAIVPGLDGSKPGIAAYAVALPVTDPPTNQVVALQADGTEIWATNLEGAPYGGTLLPGTVDGDPVPDIFVKTWDGTKAITRVSAVSGTSGAVLWDAQTLPSSAQPFAAADWNADGKTDLLLFGPANMNGTLRLLSGADGKLVKSGPVLSGWTTPLLFDLDGDASLEVVLQSAVSPVRAYAHDLVTQLGSTAEDDRPYPSGAVASCPGARVLVEGSLRYRARLKLSSLPPGGKSTTMVLAGGKKYANDDDAKKAAAWPGQLGDAAVAADLAGDGKPLAFVGSTDGWLYAFDPCSGDLVHAINFGASVGEAVLGDTNGDGNDEILTSVADGFLYAIKHQAIASPVEVLDTDPNGGSPDADVDNIVTTGELWAKWGAVPGASGYEVAVVREDEGIVSVPAWTGVGKVETASVKDLPLVQGAKYFFAVRALDGSKPPQPSVDAVSDGVVVHFPPEVDAGAGGAGGSGGGQAPGGAGGTTGAGGEQAAGAGGAPAPAPGQAAEDAGCGCRVPARAGSSRAALVLALLGLVLAARRRERRRGQRPPS
ncbi:MAG: PQQ-like beta-propeller repeat protein [Deltaproteobacteria bacterium]|nr:PQQ-like beta-propeller repeat protein [Deltaproteobacteria bacterium]